MKLSATVAVAFLLAGTIGAQAQKVPDPAMPAPSHPESTSGTATQAPAKNEMGRSVSTGGTASAPATSENKQTETGGEPGGAPGRS